MPKLKKEFPVTLSFRTTESEAKKVAAFAEYTGRGQGEVLRLLLRQAVLAEAPDIRLSEVMQGQSSSIHHEGREGAHIGET